ncbi:MAG: YitT family protein [Oscillospiraceae bacterium]|nr:YitT family protein [Oscillospiraceae bacterium]
MIGLNLRKVLLSILGGGVLAFGLYHIHSISGITEGGALGLTLLLNHWFHISPAWSALFINFICYALGLRTLGYSFLLWSALSAGSFSLFYGIFEHFPRLWPAVSELPLLAAILGALFVGVGVGLCVRAGGAPTGDDALAMSLSRRFHIPIERVYLITDLTVLALSLSYLPIGRIACSLLTVTLSGKLIGIIQRYKRSQ